MGLARGQANSTALQSLNSSTISTPGGSMLARVQSVEPRDPSSTPDSSCWAMTWDLLTIQSLNHLISKMGKVPSSLQDIWEDLKKEYK